MTHYVPSYLCLVLIAQAAAMSIRFRNCYSNGTATSMNVSPCTAQPCIFHKGTTAVVKICFKSPISTVNATARIDGIIGGVPVKFPMPNPDGCKDSGLTCPIAEGDSLCYTNTLKVLPSYPTIRLVVRWMLTGDTGVQQFCILFPVEINSFSFLQPH